MKITIDNIEIKEDPKFPGSGYYGSEDGEVYHVRKLKQCIDNRGYHKVVIYHNRKRKREWVHRIIARCFHKPDLKTKEQVDHKFKDKSKNGKSDIEVVSQKQNLHRQRYGINEPVEGAF